MDFLNWLDQHPLVISYDVLNHYDLDDATLLKLRIDLLDGSVLLRKSTSTRQLVNMPSNGKKLMIAG